MATVLVVDDDAAGVRAMREILVREGHDVSTAGDGREALRLLNSRRFDLLITDIVMPEVEGLEILRQLRRHPERPRVITISGGGRGSAAHYLELAAVLGSDLTLPKPFSREDLLAAVVDLLRRERPLRADE